MLNQDIFVPKISADLDHLVKKNPIFPSSERKGKW